MKTASEDLFHLIHSLSKAEKRSFKMLSALDKREKKYILLFDLIALQKKYDEESLVKKINVSKGHFAVYKNHLYHLILNKMSILHSGKEAHIRRLLTQADFLHSKGLHHHAEKILRKAKQFAIDLDSDSHLFEIMNMEHADSWRRRDLPGAEKAMEEDKKILELFNNKRKYRHLSNEIILTLSRSGGEKKSEEAKRMKELMNHPFIKEEKNALTFRSRNSLYHTLSLYYSVNSNPEKQYHFAKKAIDQYLNHPEKIRHDTFTYLLTLHLMLVACHSLRRFDEGKIYTDKLKSDSSWLKNEREKIWAFFTYHDTNLHYYIKTGKFSEGLADAETLIKEFESYTNKLEDSQFTVLFSHLAKIYFGSGNFSKSLLWLNKILNEKYILNVRPGFENNIKLFYLIVHYEKGNYRLLNSLAKSTQNYFSSKGSLHAFEKIILIFFSKKLSPEKSNESIMAFRKLKEEIGSILKTETETSSLEEFDFVPWIDSKIESRPFAELVRKKVEKAE